jgi:hypothetical protein
MNIKELKANKKNRNLVLYLRKVGRIYRAGFVSKELKTDLYIDFKSKFRGQNPLFGAFKVILIGAVVAGEVFFVAKLFG